MASSSSSSSMNLWNGGIEAGSDGSDSTAISSVIQTWPKRSKAVFLVKGGDVDDEGLTYTMASENLFNLVYIDYARRSGVRPSDIRFSYRGEYLSPDTSPFDKGFVQNEVILAYAQDLKTPICVNPRNPATKDFVTFTVQEMKTTPSSIRYRMERTKKVMSLYTNWALYKDAWEQDVTMTLDGHCLDKDAENGEATLDSCQFYDGAIVFATIKDPDV